MPELARRPLAHPDQAKGVRWAKDYVLSGMVEVAAAAG
jgi:hypothetical protein